jgi:hypothetical protein
VRTDEEAARVMVEVPRVVEGDLLQSLALEE